MSAWYHGDGTRPRLAWGNLRETLLHPLFEYFHLNASLTHILSFGLRLHL